MAIAQTSYTYTGDGITTSYAVPFGYLAQGNVKVKVGGAYYTSFTFVTYGTIQLASAPASGVEVKVYRETAGDQVMWRFQENAPFLPIYIDEDFKQLLYLIQENAATISEVQSHSIRTLDAIDAIPQDAEERAGKALTFNSSGDPIATLIDPSSGTSLASALQEPDGAKLIGYDHTNLYNVTPSEILSWQDSTCVFENELLIKDSTDPTIAALGASSQGFTVVDYGNSVKIYNLHPVSASYTNKSTSRIVEYTYTGDGSAVEVTGYSSEINIGHQGIGHYFDGAELYLYFPMGVIRDDASGVTQSGKGISRVKWKNGFSQSDLEHYQLFAYNDSASTQWGLINYQITPSVTPDGQYLVASYKKQPGGQTNYYIGVWSLPEILGAADPLTVAPITTFYTPPLLTDYPQYSQSICTDGKSIFQLNGSSFYRKSCFIRKYSMSGILQGTLEVEGIAAYHGYSKVLDGTSDWGIPRHAEPEGLACLNGRLMVITTDQWRAFGDIVSYGSFNYALVNSGGTTCPAYNQASYDWVQTRAEATAGEWSADTTYSNLGAYTRNTVVLFSVANAAAVGSSAITFPIQAGVCVQKSPAMYPMGQTDYTMSVPRGLDFRLGQWESISRGWTSMFNISGTGSHMSLYDTRVTSDKKGYFRVYAYSVPDVMYRARLRYGSGADSGAGIDLCGDEDPTYAGNTLFYNNGKRTAAFTTTGHMTLYDVSDDGSQSSHGSLYFRNNGGTESFRLMYGDSISEGGAIYLNGVDDSTNNGAFAVYGAGSKLLQMNMTGTKALRPGADATQRLGTADTRWSEVCAASGTINTSDAREKTEVSPLSEAELTASKALASEIGMYQFLTSVEEKGADTARYHCGMTVQRAIEIMKGAGLDPMRYSFICYDKWEAIPAVLDEQGNVIAEERPAGDRYSFRVSGLNSFILRGLSARLDALEDKLK